MPTDENPSGAADSSGSRFSPAEFMKGRHPDLYPDSTVVRHAVLSRQLFEYHLETLTSRNQETEFADFCRRLAEQEICPNLRPQTGPTGGGDSKADSETIPVSSEIALRWVGADPAAAEERWAFAFSAKKDWKAKVKKDVAGIVGTERGYKRIYFITNQYARDKDRAALEDKLSKDYDTQVIILDKTWIVAAIFEHNRIDIAIESLHIDEIGFKEEKRVGKLDSQREEELRELVAQIDDQTKYVGAQYQLGEDCLKAAILVRNLGKARSEIDAYFMRALKVVEDLGHSQQRLRVTYAYAWTVIFWYEDTLLFNSLYDSVESLARGTLQASDIGKLFNLWQVLLTEVRRGAISGDAAKLNARHQVLSDELARLAADQTRPNNALDARTDLALMALNDAIFGESVEKTEEAWDELSQIVDASERLGDYPFERFVSLIEEIGKLGIESDRFEKLFEKVVKLLETRRSEGAGGGLFLNLSGLSMPVQPRKI